VIGLLVNILLAGLVLLAIYGVGRALRRLAPLTFWGRAADLAYSLAFGLGALTTLLFGLALLGLLRPATGWALLAGGLALAGWQVADLRDDLKAGWAVLHEVLTASWFIRVVILLGAAYALLNLVGDLAPPVEGDTVHQYLLLPRYWVEAGRYTQPTNIWAATLPGNMMMLSAWGLLLQGTTPVGYSLASLITGLGMSAFLALGVYALARTAFGRGPAALAAIVVYTMPDAGYLAQSAKVDMGWAFFEALALAAVLRWIDSSRDSPKNPGSIRWLILAGLCLGWAAGSKNQTFISVVLLGGWIVLREAFRGEWRGLVRVGLAFGISTLLTGFPYYLYNAIAHLNPFYPVFAGPFVTLFGATPSPRTELGTEIFYPWTLGGYLTNLWNASLGHGPDFYLGFIAGPIFLLALPVGMLRGWLRGERAAWRMLGYAFVFSVVWFLVKQAARHFLPGLVLLGAVAGFILWHLAAERGAAGRIVQIMAVFVLSWNCISSAGVLYWNGAYRVALGIDSPTSYLQRWHDEVITPVFPDWETITVLNDRLGPTDRVLAEYATSPLYIEPQLVSGNWGDRQRVDDIDDIDELLRYLSAHNIRYVLDYSADPENVPLYTSPAFLAAYGELLYDGPRTQLYRIAAPKGD
jgi:4-amino-4-deoxy-L-arabinose transferase-like glycosyltransferase